MQATHTAILCFALVSCAMAQFIQGERKEGDVLIAIRRIFKPAIPFKPMVARVGASVNGTITMIEVTDVGPHNSFTKVLRGGVGQSDVYLMVFGKRGEGLLIEVKVYALENPGPTEPISTETPAPSEPSTEEPASNPPTTAESSTEEPASNPPTTAESSTEEPTSNPPNTEESSTAKPTPSESNTDEPDSSEQPSSKQPLESTTGIYII